MLTPVIMLVLLTLPYAFVRMIDLITGKRRRQFRRIAGCLGVTLVFWFTGVGHFIETEGMVDMLPPWMPSRRAIIYSTGVLELIAAVLLLLPQARRLVGIALVAMLVVFLSVNVYAALNRVGLGGHEWGPSYLLIRVPLQLVLMAWIWWFAVQGTRGQKAEVSGPTV